MQLYTPWGKITQKVQSEINSACKVCVLWLCTLGKGASLEESWIHRSNRHIQKSAVRRNTTPPLGETWKQRLLLAWKAAIPLPRRKWLFHLAHTFPEETITFCSFPLFQILYQKVSNCSTSSTPNKQTFWSELRVWSVKMNCKSLLQYFQNRITSMQNVGYYY